LQATPLLHASADKSIKRTTTYPRYNLSRRNMKQTPCATGIERRHGTTCTVVPEKAKESEIAKMLVKGLKSTLAEDCQPKSGPCMPSLYSIREFYKTISESLRWRLMFIRWQWWRSGRSQEGTNVMRPMRTRSVLVTRWRNLSIFLPASKSARVLGEAIGLAPCEFKWLLRPIGKMYRSSPKLFVIADAHGLR
jgi:hypothetical protein